jgi:histidinol-phosphate aminotransferase
MSRFLKKQLNNIEPYTPGEQPQGQQLVKLNTNELPYAPSPLAVKAAQDEAQRINLYSDPSCGVLNEVLAGYLGVGLDNVFTCNGSDEVLAFAFQGLCPNGAAFADLTYGFYPVFAELYGIEPKIIPLAYDFAILPGDYAKTDRTVVIANPNSPTGLALSRGEIESILAQNRNRLVIVDEAYIAFGGESAVPLLQKYDNLLVIGTLSKAHGLAGARLGYAAAKKDIIDDLNRIKYSFNPYNVNRMTQAAGAAALRDKEYFAQCVDKVISTREKALETLRAIGFICTDSKSNFLFVSYPGMSAEMIYARLRERNVLVRWFNLPRANNYLRITVGTEAQMQLLFTALREIIQ